MSTLHQSSSRIAALGAPQYHCPGRKKYSPLYTGGLYFYICQTFSQKSKKTTSRTTTIRFAEMNMNFYQVQGRRSGTRMNRKN